MNPEQFRQHAHKVIDDIVDYYQNVGDQYNVVSQVEPGYLRPLLPDAAPQEPVPFDEVHKDLFDKIMPGITHWQHPNFFAYFPANTSFPAMLADMYSGALNPIAFSWICSPAATELETIVLDWLCKAMALPDHFLSSGKGGGAIQCTASDAIIVCLLAAKKKAVETYLSQHSGATENGRPIDKYDVHRKLVAYSSEYTHTSFAKACIIADVNFVSIPARSMADKEHPFGMDTDLLKAQMEQDIAEGRIPFFVCGTIGTTSHGAVDDLQAIGTLARKHDLWFHIDAAYAGAAMVCEEFRHHLNGVEHADSYNTNAHKWMLTNFDCSPLWLKDRSTLVDAFSISAPYYRNKATEAGLVIDYRDWQLPLGRRFRSLKLWFVLRMYGLQGIQAHIRQCVKLNKDFCDMVASDSRFQVVRQAFALTVLRLVGTNAENRELMDRVQARNVMLSGCEAKLADDTSARELYPGLDAGKDARAAALIRVVSGTAQCQPAHYERLWKLFAEEAEHALAKRLN
ncbi:hypothetical protein RI367_007988 [Sorochytrium milnesiophthora]